MTFKPFFCRLNRRPNGETEGSEILMGDLIPWHRVCRVPAVWYHVKLFPSTNFSRARENKEEMCLARHIYGGYTPSYSIIAPSPSHPPSGAASTSQDIYRIYHRPRVYVHSSQIMSKTPWPTTSNITQDKPNQEESLIQLRHHENRNPLDGSHTPPLPAPAAPLPCPALCPELGFGG